MFGLLLLESAGAFDGAPKIARINLVHDGDGGGRHIKTRATKRRDGGEDGTGQNNGLAKESKRHGSDRRDDRIYRESVLAGTSLSCSNKVAKRNADVLNDSTFWHGDAD